MEILISGLVGVGLTLLIAALGFLISSTQEHRRWVREKRLDAYLKFMRAVSLMRRMVEENHEGKSIAAHIEQAEEHGRQSADYLLILPPAMREKAETLKSELRYALDVGKTANYEQALEIASDATEEFRRLARADLGLDMPIRTAWWKFWRWFG